MTWSLDPDPTPAERAAALAEALAGLDRVQQEPWRYLGRDVRQAELVVTWNQRRQDYEARLVAYGAPGAPAARAGSWSGWAPLLPGALVALWRGDLGVWRFADPEGWERERYPQGRPPAGNPGPAPGQRLGRGDG